MMTTTCTFLLQVIVEVAEEHRWVLESVRVLRRDLQLLWRGAIAPRAARGRLQERRSAT